MEVTEREGFSKVLIGIGQIYGKSISPLLVKMYWELLVKYDLHSVVKALEAHAQDPDVGQFMPKPADLIRILRGDSQSQSLKAWTKVEQAIRHVGPYQSVVFDEPVIHQVITEMGGWIKLCQTKEKELPFVAKEFQTRFASYRHQLPKEFPSFLPGISAHQNGYQGYWVESPVLLGDKTKAQAVLSRGCLEANKPVLAPLPLRFTSDDIRNM